MNIGSIVRTNAIKVNKILVKESPTILLALGVTGVITTVILAVKATPKALYLLDGEMFHRAKKDPLREPEPLTKLETIKLTWKCYIPTVLIGTTSIACIIASNSINLRRNAALASIYTITEATLKEYQQKVVDVIGKNKEQKIRDEISQDKLNNNPFDGQTVILTGRGETLFYDSLSGRYFKSDIENIRQIQNDFNRDLLTEMYKPLNDLYEKIGLEDTEIGRHIGWNIESGMLDISFGAKIAKDGIPCIVMNYKLVPQRI